MDKRNSTLRVCIVGCGVISANHISALLEEDVEIVALCDIKPERAVARAEKYGITPKIYTSFIEMLDKEVPDSVHICTPHHLHAPMAIECLKRNINVFLEKPIGISTEEIDMLIETEKTSLAKICVCFQNRFNASVQVAKSIIDEDGGALVAYGSLFWQRGEKYYTESDWRGFYATEGGGVMINQAIHTIDLLCFFLGIPKKVSAVAANHHLKGIIEVEDSCGGRIVFENGKIANFYATTACQGVDSYLVLLKTKNHRIEIMSPVRVYVDGARIDLKAPEKYISKECYGDGHFKVIADFYKSIVNNTQVPVSLDDAKHALKVVLGSYKSNGADIDI